MTYTTSNLVNNTCQVSASANPSIKLGFMPRFGCKQQMPTKQVLCNLATVSKNKKIMDLNNLICYNE